MISVRARGYMLELLGDSSGGCRRAAKREAQMSASLEHEFEGRVSGDIRITSRAYPGISG